MLLDEEYVNKLINENTGASKEVIQEILEKATLKRGLSHKDIAILLNIEEDDQMEQLMTIAGQMKDEIYGNRVVMFAPLYISDHCVNSCRYCGYRCENKFNRKKLTMKEISEEVIALEKEGHKRLALEVGEDPVNNDINFVLEAIKTIYDTQGDRGEIRRINVNIAATTTEEYKMLKEAGIGTYILFQETYNKKSYEYMHPDCIKGNYDYHLSAFERAMEAGIDDVGGGVLFGLSDYRFEVLSLMLHNEFLEEKFNVGFHTISVPRLKKAEGMDLSQFKHLVDDKTFQKIVAVLRVAVPFTGIILSTRETAEMRHKMIRSGISQLSAGSCTDVGGYSEKKEDDVIQFQLSDERPTREVLEAIIKDGFIPSYCTACYRLGRTGDRFMQLAKSGEIQNTCTPNALMTLMEYTCDFGDKKLRVLADDLVEKEIAKLKKPAAKKMTRDRINRIIAGERDLFV